MPAPRAVKVQIRNSSSRKIRLRVDDKSHGIRLDKFLAAGIPSLSRSRLKHLIETGMVELSGESTLKPGKKLSAGQSVIITIPSPDPLDIIPEDIPLDVMFEDEHLVVVNKPAGMVVHPGAGNDTGTLVHALLARCRDLSGIGGRLRPGIVHRLDKDTSGLIIAAKTDQAHNLLAEMFSKRLVQKIYTALVQGQLADSSGIINLPIGRHPHRRTRMSVNHRNGRDALTAYQAAGNLGPHQRLDLTLHTGRTHQIRVHLSHIGHPILGDRTYGGTTLLKGPDGRKMTVKRQMLHSSRLEFRHPVTGERICLAAPPPEDMKAVIRFLSRIK